MTIAASLPAQEFSHSAKTHASHLNMLQCPVTDDKINIHSKNDFVIRW